eukprot:gene18762-20653_t
MDDQEELTLIDYGIENLTSLQLAVNLVHVNLHCNRIDKIENLGHLVNLKSLDLSSNVIAEIQGLENLRNLRNLNLSSNLIKTVENLKPLRKLERLDLSYNKVNSLIGLKEVRPSTHVLKFIDFHGNNISSFDHVINCLANCSSLEVLIFQDGSDGNAICKLPSYRPNIFAQLSRLKVLDCEDRFGNFVATDEYLTRTNQGLNEYLDWLLGSNQSNSVKECDSEIDIPTPKIDEILQKFKDKRSKHESENKDDATQQLTGRLAALERQISSLVKVQKEKQISAERDVVLTTTATTEKSTTSPESSPVPKQRIKNQPSKVKSCKIPTRAKAQKTLPEMRGKPTRVKSSTPSSDIPKFTRPVRDPKDDESALLLMQELEEERERRWKAEQAARKLVDTVKELQDKLSEERKLQEAAISTSVRLKSAFTSEKDSRLALEKSLVQKEERIEELTKQMDALQASEVQSKKLIKSLEESSRNSENETRKQEAFKVKQLRESQCQAAASFRETELLRVNVKNLKSQVTQLQELLASREQEHKEKLTGMVQLDGKEIREIIEKEIAKQEGRYSQLIRQFNERIESRNRDYAALEDEFRMGLQLEANRFSELQDAYSHLSNESSELKKNFQLFKQKESKATSLVTELTSMVKEQKGRLTEVSRSKIEMQSELKERIQVLESQLETSRKQLSKMEAHRQEKDKLLAQVKALESVIEGLRTERKLWGHELAQQGASLAHDRGRLESQIEALGAENKRLKQTEKEQTDSLRIKSKVVEDQTDTIKRLRQELLDHKEESKRIIDEIKDHRRSLESEIEDEKKTCQELQETVDALTCRKEELKELLAKSNKNLERSQEELRSMKKQWEERSILIGQLETRVVKMKETYDEKEKKLKDERDSSLKKANSAMEKARICDDAFRRQLDEQKREHELEKRKIIAEKEDEIRKAKEKISETEDEMRLLLEETAISKRNLEAKIKQLSKAFLDVQQDLTG